MTNLQTKAMSAISASDLVVHYRPSERTLTVPQQQAIGQWVAGWIGQRPDAVVAMGCEGGSSRQARTERLRLVRELLVKSGVPVDRIRFTDEAIALPAQGSPVAACLKLVSAQSLERGVMPIRALFVQNPAGSAPCSSAS